jgi:D-sedoheptulose 7-phosphate isomerase
MNFSAKFLEETGQITTLIDANAIESVAQILADTRDKGGRLFILGVGGSAGNASHAVNDFRKIAEIEAYAPTDNISELTARTNDEGWPTVFEAWLKGSRLKPEDTLLVLSVSGGSLKQDLSSCLVRAVQYAKDIGSRVTGIVGQRGGYTAAVADACVIVPVVNPNHVTPHSEAWQGIVWHLLVSHPRLKKIQTKWESLPSRAVFFDRDGTLTVDPKSVSNPEVALGASEAIMRLQKAGFKVIIVTNQPDIQRGLATWETFEESSKNMPPVDDIYVCPHSDEAHCLCRKPRTGMLTQAASEHNIDLKQSYMVGDSWRDIEAGKRAGCKTVWFRNTLTPPGKHCLGGMPGYIATTLEEVASWILENSK